MTRMGAERHICWRRARARSRWPAWNDVAAVNFVVQLTMDELSHWSPHCTCWRDVRVPANLGEVHQPFRDHWLRWDYFRIVGWRLVRNWRSNKCSDLYHSLVGWSTPLLLHTIYMHLYSHGCVTLMGWFTIFLKSHRKSEKAALSSRVRGIQPPLFFAILVACHMVVKSPRPPGIPIMEAWCREPAIFWKSLSRIFFFFARDLREFDAAMDGLVCSLICFIMGCDDRRFCIV